MWGIAVANTLWLILLTSCVSFLIGGTTAVLAWASNRRWAYFIPLLLLAVPPWLVAYQLTDVFMLINPWVGAALSLGVVGSIYPHTIISSGLSGRAHQDWEMLSVARGKNLKSLLIAIYPSLRLSLLPSLAIISAECIADFGVSNFYGLNTVTMLSYNMWASTWSLSAVLWGLGILLVAGVIISRLDSVDIAGITTKETSKTSNIFGALAIFPTIFVVSFSAYKSIEWVLMHNTILWGDLLNEIADSLLLVVVVVAVCALVLSLYLGGFGKKFVRRLGLATYSIPGIVVGMVAVYLLGGFIPLMILLVLAVAFRYFGLMVQSVSASERGSSKYFEIIDSYSNGWADRFTGRLKLLAPNIALGVSLVVLDVLRELPISIVLQPMGFQTLAMRMNYIAKTEDPTLLGFHSLVLLLLGLVFSLTIVWITHAQSAKSNH